MRARVCIYTTCVKLIAYAMDASYFFTCGNGRSSSAHLRMVFGKLWQKHSHYLSILILFELGGSTEEASPHHGALLCIATGTVHLRFGEPPTVWRVLPTVLDLTRSARHG